MRAVKPASVLVVYTVNNTREEKSTFEIVQNALKKYNIAYDIANREKLSKEQFRNKDLVIAVGGDGTFLRAAHFIESQVLFGVNSDRKNKEGFFMQSDKNDFEKKLKRLADSRIEIKKLPRLEAFINNKKAETLAVNEFFVGPKKSYHAATYRVEANGKKERQKSSGILITTPAGSYAWAKSCCNRTMPLDSKGYQFVVRELYKGRLFRNYELEYGVLGKNQSIVITSEMLDGILVADSVSEEYRLKSGDKVTVRMSNKCLRVIWPK